MDEVQQLEKVKRYLMKLGYPLESIFFEYQIDKRKRADIVVKDNEGVLIVIEVRHNLDFDADIKKEISYHPVVRDLQKNAFELQAKYFIISNGSKHFWLQTAPNGRPENINEITFTSLSSNTLSKVKFIENTLFNLTNYLRSFPFDGDTLYEISIIYYYKLLLEHDLNTEEFLYSITGKSNLTWHPYNSYIKKALIESTYKLEAINFTENSDIILNYIDKLFELSKADLTIPRWISDFMVKILSAERQDYVIDMFARKGTITGSAYLNGNTNIHSYCTNKIDIYWIKIHQLLTIGREEKLEVYSLYNALDGLWMSNLADGALLAPPFNVKMHPRNNSYFEYLDLKDSTSNFIEFAINSLKLGGRLVAIVPDSFLLLSHYSKVRDYLQDTVYVEAIISLPPNSFKPYSKIKSSLISFVKKSHSYNDPCFFASIEEVPYETQIDNYTTSTLSSVLANLDQFRSNRFINPSKLGFAVSNLNSENFHFSKYWFELNYTEPVNLQAGFISIPLKQLLVDSRRGSEMVSNKEGEIPYIGPGAIRSMRLIKHGLTYTTKDKIPKRVLYVEAGDIVVNAIGPYRGKAAIVNDEFDGLAVNRHVIVLKPNSKFVRSGYLATVINSTFVQEQLIGKSIGAVIPALNINSFEDIYIPVPSLEEQKSIYEEYLIITNKLAETENKIASLKLILAEKLNQFGKEDIKK